MGKAFCKVESPQPPPLTFRTQIPGCSNVNELANGGVAPNTPYYFRLKVGEPIVLKYARVRGGRIVSCAAESAGGTTKVVPG